MLHELWLQSGTGQRRWEGLPDDVRDTINFCGWQRYERGELVDVLWGELEWSSPTDDDELPEVTGPAWIVDKVAHYGG